MLTPSRALVLIVDDHADTRRLIGDCLEASGIDVVAAAHGKEALDLLVGAEGVQPRLILLDIEMPVMNGWELLAILKNYRRLSRIPIVVLSGTEPHADLLERGTIVGYLVKPLDTEVLRTRVLEWLGPG